VAAHLDPLLRAVTAPVRRHSTRRAGVPMNSGRSGSHCVLTTSWPGLTGLTGLTRPSTPFSPSVLQDVDGRHEAHEAGHDVERSECNKDGGTEERTVQIEWNLH